MSVAPATSWQRSRKKKVIAGLTLVLLLVLVSLLGGLSSQMSPSSATIGLALPPKPAAPPGVAVQPAISPRPLPRPKPNLAGPPLTPAEEILMEIARYGGSATDDAFNELPELPGPVEEPPLLAAVSPPPETSGAADYPWPRLPHDSLLLPRQLAGGSGDCPCGGDASPCPEGPPPAAYEVPGPENPLLPPINDEHRSGDQPGPPITEDLDNPPLIIPEPDDPPLIIPGPDGPPPIVVPDPADREAPPVPEPGTLFLAGTGLACLAALGRQRRRRSSPRRANDHLIIS